MAFPLTSDILRAPISHIPQLSPAFQARCRACGFHNLLAICKLGAEEASRPRCLGPVLFSELVDFLAARRLLHTLVDHS